MMLRNQAGYMIMENTPSFMRNLTDQKYIEYFNYNTKFASWKKQFKKELEVLAMTLPQITEGFMFQDEELFSVLGKKSHNNDTELYEEMLETVRANPINKNAVGRGVNKYLKPIIQARL